MYFEPKRCVSVSFRNEGTTLLITYGKSAALMNDFKFMNFWKGAITLSNVTVNIRPNGPSSHPFTSKPYWRVRTKYPWISNTSYQRSLWHTWVIDTQQDLCPFFGSLQCLWPYWYHANKYRYLAECRLISLLWNAWYLAVFLKLSWLAGARLRCNNKIVTTSAIEV